MQHHRDPVEADPLIPPPTTPMRINRTELDGWMTASIVYTVNIKEWRPSWINQEMSSTAEKGSDSAAVLFLLFVRD